MGKARIIDANKLLGLIDMSCDQELAEYEAAKRHGIAWMLFPQRRPTYLERDRISYESFEEAISRIR